MPADRPGAVGFTLIEMMVALSVFALAALALLRLQAFTLTSARDVEGRVLAGIVARNIATEYATAPAPLALGQREGTQVNGGQSWRWRAVIRRADDVRLLRIDIAVSGTSGAPARLTIIRPVTL